MSAEFQRNGSKQVRRMRMSFASDPSLKIEAIRRVDGCDEKTARGIRKRSI
jgi:hypothetical protein